MEAIKTENLTKHYGKARGIEQISLTVEEGEFFGFIGPNGAGKSTTIRTLLGLISPTGGQAAVLGFDIVKEKEKILAETGYLPSEAMFHPGMRVREVLKSPNNYPATKHRQQQPAVKRGLQPQSYEISS